MTFCGKCGYNNPEECRFCVNCGADLNEAMGQEPVAEEEVVAEEKTLEGQAVNDVERIPAYDPNKEYAAPQQPPKAQQFPPYGAPMVPPMRGRQASSYNPAGRRFGIILAISALVVTLVTLFIIPMDYASFDNTILRIGMSEGHQLILIMVFVTLAISVVSLIEPIFSVGTAVCLIALAMIMYQEVSFFGIPEAIIIGLIAADVAVLGIVATVFMKKFVSNNINGVPLFKACYLAWTGIPHM